MNPQDVIDRVRDLLVTLEDELVAEPEPEPEPEPPVEPEPEPEPVGDLADTELGRVAAALAPGDVAPLKGNLPTVDAWGQPVEGHFSNLIQGRRTDGTAGPSIDTWTDRGHWDPHRQRAFFQGLRQANRFLVYHAADNRWEEIPLKDVPNAPPLFEQYGHLYTRTALDWTRGHFYRLRGHSLHRYVIDENRWEHFTDTPMGGHTIEYHEALDRLINVVGTKLIGFRDGKFTELGESAVDGYHSSAKYNRITGEMLIIGGNRSPSKVDIVTLSGEIRHMNNAPFEFYISSDDLTYDPASGSFLVLHSTKKLWEYRSDLDEWRVAADWSAESAVFPFHRYFKQVPFTIDALGVIAWQTPGDWLIHRPDSVFTDAPAIEPIEPPLPVDPEDPPEDPIEPDEPTPVIVRPAPIESDNLLLDAAEGMAPGEWRNITNSTTWPLKPNGQDFKRFQTVRNQDPTQSGGADGMGWTQSLVLANGRLMLMLMRGSFEYALMVMESNGRWWRANQPPGFIGAGRRPFNRLTQDDTYLYFAPSNKVKTEMGHFIRVPLDVQEDSVVFEHYGVDIGDDQMDSVGNFAVTWVPEWQRFYAYTPGGKVTTWTHGEPAWTQIGRMQKDENGIMGTGYAGLILWNPVRKELIAAGGQNFSNPTAGKVARFTEPMGEMEPLPNMRKPDGSDLIYTSAEARIFVDPRDGSYLHASKDAQIIYKNDTVGGTYSVYEDQRPHLPFGGWERYTPLSILRDDIYVFVSHTEGVVLHRLKEQI